jgi:hypothetical protein
MPQVVHIKTDNRHLNMVQIKKYSSKNAARTIAAKRYAQFKRQTNTKINK